MIGPAPSVRPRPMGGFSQGMGAFGEHLDESAMQAAMKQKTLQQQQSNTTPQTGKSGTNPVPTPPQQAAPQQPREVSTLVDELIKRPAADITEGLKSIFDINALLGIGPTDTPDQQAKKQEFHKRYQELTEEEKQVAQKKYQQEMQKKKQEEEEEQLKAQQEEQQKANSLVVPASTKKGPIGPASGGSKKQSTELMMQQQRKTLGNAGQKH